MRLTERIIAITMLLGALAVATPARAEPERIAVLLSAYEDVPGDADLLRGRSRFEVEQSLIALSADPARPLFVRARATELLGHFRSEATRARLEVLLDEEREHPALLLSAVRASSKFGAELTARVQRYLSHPDVHLRESAIVALAKSGDRRTLETRLVEEENPRLRARIIEELSAR